MANQKISKSLPKRVMNTHAKESRHQSWLQGKERKALRQKEQEKRHQNNLRLISEGKLTPWQESKAKAKQRKAEAKSASKKAA